MITRLTEEEKIAKDLNAVIVASVEIEDLARLARQNAEMLLKGSISDELEPAVVASLRKSAKGLTDKSIGVMFDATAAASRVTIRRTKKAVAR